MKVATLISAAAALTALSLLVPEQASAQHACDLNGGPPPDGTLFAGELYCGDISSFFQKPDQTAVGEGIGIFGEGATAVGSRAEADDDGSTAIGFHADASDTGGGFLLPLPTDYSQTALGSFSAAIGAGSVAIGDQAVVGVPDLISNPGAILYDPVANGTAIGSHSVVTGDNGTAIGMSAQATAASGTAVGQNAQATASNSVAIGANSVANQANTVSVGSAGLTRRIVNVAAGTAATDAVNVSQLGAVTTNVTALQAADVAFDTRIDALESAAVGFNHDLDKIDDHASAGTAAAVALSGAMFLPGKSFNLTGNVGAYRGAYAGALQLGALVSDNVALNAGIAHGFNKGGKTALRAGFTFGW